MALLNSFYLPSYMHVQIACLGICINFDPAKICFDKKENVPFSTLLCSTKWLKFVLYVFVSTRVNFPSKPANNCLVT
jgi:hypothetical protein